MRSTQLRRKMFIQAIVTCCCLYEAVGCPQIFSNALIDGTRSFLENGLPAAILAAFSLDTDLGTVP